MPWSFDAGCWPLFFSLPPSPPPPPAPSLSGAFAFFIMSSIKQQRKRNRNATETHRRARYISFYSKESKKKQINGVQVLTLSTRSYAVTLPQLSDYSVYSIRDSPDSARYIHTP